jgi:hypothetical protein
MREASELVSSAEAELQRREYDKPSKGDAYDESADNTDDKMATSLSVPSATPGDTSRNIFSRGRSDLVRTSTPRTDPVTEPIDPVSRKEQLINTLRRRVSEIGKEAIVLRVMKGDYQDGGEYRFPDAEFLQTWYKLDRNCKPPVYRLQKIR